MRMPTRRSRTRYTQRNRARGCCCCNTGRIRQQQRHRQEVFNDRECNYTTWEALNRRIRRGRGLSARNERQTEHPQDMNGHGRQFEGKVEKTSPRVSTCLAKIPNSLHAECCAITSFKGPHTMPMFVPFISRPEAGHAQFSSLTASCKFSAVFFSSSAVLSHLCVISAN